MKPLEATPGFKRKEAVVSKPAICVTGWEMSGCHPDIGPFAIVSPTKKGVLKFWDHLMTIKPRKSGMHHVALFENKNVESGE